MGQVVIIFGKGDKLPTGKSFLATQMSLLFDNPIELDGKNIRGSFGYSPITKDNDCVIVDDILPDFDLEQLVVMATSGHMYVHRKGDKSLFIKSPQFIVTTNMQAPELAQLNRAVKYNVKFIETYIEDGTFHAKKVKL